MMCRHANVQMKGNALICWYLLTIDCLFLQERQQCAYKLLIGLDMR